LFDVKNSKNKRFKPMQNSSCENVEEIQLLYGAFGSKLLEGVG
jgi:hypothetical protein